MRNVNHIRHIGKRNIVVAFDEHHFLRARLENIGQASLQSVPCCVFVVDLYTRLLAGAAIDQLNHDRSVGRIVLRSIRRRRLGHQRVQSFWSQRRNHHEDNQQNQQNVDERRDVNNCALSPARSSCHSHSKLLLLPANCRRRRSSGCLFLLIGKQAQLIHAGGAHIVHDLNN